jgi:hypothetical protein
MPISDLIYFNVHVSIEILWVVQLLQINYHLFMLQGIFNKYYLFVSYMDEDSGYI